MPGRGSFQTVCDKFQGPVKNSILCAHPHPPPFKKYRIGYRWSFKMASKIKIRVVSEEGKGYVGPLTPFFPSRTNFPKCPPPPFQTHSLARREPPTHPLGGLRRAATTPPHPPSRPSQARDREQELKDGVRKVLGCSTPRTHTRLSYPLSTSPHPPTPTWLVRAQGDGGGGGRRAGGQTGWERDRESTW